jgi:hypothetical protein
MEESGSKFVQKITDPEHRFLVCASICVCSPFESSHTQSVQVLIARTVRIRIGSGFGSGSRSCSVASRHQQRKSFFYFLCFVSTYRRYMYISLQKNNAFLRSHKIAGINFSYSFLLHVDERIRIRVTGFEM